VPGAGMRPPGFDPLRFRGRWPTSRVLGETQPSPESPGAGVRSPGLEEPAFRRGARALRRPLLLSRASGTRNLPSGLSPHHLSAAEDPFPGVTRACVMDRIATAGGKWATPL